MNFFGVKRCWLSAFYVSVSLSVITPTVEAQTQTEAAHAESAQTGSENGGSPVEAVTDDASPMTAQNHYEAGVQLAQDRNYGEAQKQFELALRASNAPLDAYFGLGQVELALGHPCAALTAYENYLARGGTRDDDNQKLRQHMQQLRSAGASAAACATDGTAELVVSCNLPEVRATLDGQELPDLGAPQRVAAGHHEVIFSDGATNLSRLSFEAKPNGRHYVGCAERPLSSGVPAAPTSTGTVSSPAAPSPGAEPPQRWTTGQKVGLALLGTGVAAGVTTLALFAYNGGQYRVWSQSDEHKNVEQGAPASEEFEHVRDSIDQLSAATVGLAVASGVLAATGVTLIILGKKKDRKVTGELAFCGSFLSMKGEW